MAAAALGPGRAVPAGRAGGAGEPPLLAAVLCVGRIWREGRREAVRQRAAAGVCVCVGRTCVSWERASPGLH